jgi:hypothetical protein
VDDSAERQERGYRPKVCPSDSRHERTALAAAANEEHRHQCADLNDESSSHRLQDDAGTSGYPEDRPEGVVEGFVSLRPKKRLPEIAMVRPKCREKSRDELCSRVMARCCRTRPVRAPHRHDPISGVTAHNAADPG